MPVLVAWLLNGLRILFMSRIGLFIMTAMTWLGINWGTMTMVIEPTLNLLRGFAQGTGGGGGQYVGIAQQWMGVLQFDRALTMVISAYVTQQTIMRGRLYLFKKAGG